MLKSIETYKSKGLCQTFTSFITWILHQIWGKAFTLESLDRKLVPLEEKVKVSGLWLRCVPAPDGCQRWKWRVRDGKLELRD